MYNLFGDAQLELSFNCKICDKPVSVPSNYTENSFTCPYCQASYPLPQSVSGALPFALLAQDAFRAELKKSVLSSQRT